MTDQQTPPGTRIRGTPRSIAEMDFVAGMHPCPSCGDHSAIAWETGGTGSVWLTRGRCPRCASERIYVFEADADLADAEHPDLELGGPAPSTVIDVLAFLREIDRVSPSISMRSNLAAAEKSSNWDRIERVQTALAELEKFIPEGADAIPASALGSPDAIADQRSRPERYTREWIVDERGRLGGTGQGAGTASKKETTMRGTLDRKAADAHKAWVRRGKTGDGRLDVVGFDASGLRLDGSEIIGARLEGVKFEGANVSYTDLTDAELIGCDFARSQINSARFAGATITRCTFDGAAAGLADFQRARVTDSSFSNADLDRSRWKDGTATNLVFRSVRFGNTQYDGATFTACDFREAQFQPTTRNPPATMLGTVYQNCDFRDADFTGSDLRGATFRGCKFGGAHGKPASMDNVTVVDADFSEAADGSDRGELPDLIEQLAD